MLTSWGPEALAVILYLLIWIRSEIVITETLKQTFGMDCGKSSFESWRQSIYSFLCFTK